jgi:hypothetical protein
MTIITNSCYFALGLSMTVSNTSGRLEFPAQFTDVLMVTMQLSSKLKKKSIKNH